MHFTIRNSMPWFKYFSLVFLVCYVTRNTYVLTIFLGATPSRQQSTAFTQMLLQLSSNATDTSNDNNPETILAPSSTSMPSSTSTSTDKKLQLEQLLSSINALTAFPENHSVFTKEMLELEDLFKPPTTAPTVAPTMAPKKPVRLRSACRGSHCLGYKKHKHNFYSSGFVPVAMPNLDSNDNGDDNGDGDPPQAL